jgi:hypothetical protein
MKTAFFTILGVSFIMVGCKPSETKFCAENGFRYIKFHYALDTKAVAPDFNKLGLPARCEVEGE